jgi:hypothetical protein
LKNYCRAQDSGNQLSGIQKKLFAFMKELFVYEKDLRAFPTRNLPMKIPKVDFFFNVLENISKINSIPSGNELKN